MKNFKIKNFGGVLLALALTSCTSLNTQRVFNSVDDIFGNKNRGEVVEINPNSNINNKEKIKEEKVEEKILTSSDVSFYLNTVKNRLRTNQRVEEDLIKPNYKVLVGEYLILNTNGENSAKVATSPKNTNPRVKINNNKLYFRSIYRGNYGINLYQDNYLSKKINIDVTSKNNFSESNIYDIILENSEKNPKILKDTITLYKIYYPNGRHYKNVSYELLKYGYNNNDNRIMNEALEVIKSNISSFNDEDKKLILEAATLTKKKIFIPESLYFTSDENLQKNLADYIKSKDILDKKDKIFLEKNFPNLFEKNDNEINDDKDNKDDNFNIFQEKRNNKENNIREYKKALSQEKSKVKKAEIYYNLMKQSVNSGNKEKALRYFSLIKQQDPNSEWVKKAGNLINTIK